MKPRFRSLRNWFHRFFKTRSIRLDGITLRTDLDELPREVVDLLRRGTYEYAERRLLLSVLGQSDRVLEIGAGIGVLGLVAARVCGAENVRCYEANPATAKIIEANQSANGLFPEVIHKAVTVDGGPIRFNSMDNIISSSLIERDGSRAIEIDSVSLSDAIEEFRPTILLMDVEGAEVDLLPAADLASIRAIVLETHAKICGRDAINDLTTLIAERGFKIAKEANNNLLFVRPQAG